MATNIRLQFIHRAVVVAQLAALIETSIMVNRSNDITLALGESFILGSGHILTDEHLGKNFQIESNCSKTGRKSISSCT